MCGGISTEVFHNTDSRNSIATLLGAVMLAFGIRDPSAHYQPEQNLPLVNQKPSWGIAGCSFLQGLPSIRTAIAQGNTKVLPHPQIRPPDPQIPGTQHLCSDTEQEGMAPPAPPQLKQGSDAGSILSTQETERNIRDTMGPDSTQQGYRSCIKTILNSLVAHPFRFILLPQDHMLLAAT